MTTPARLDVAITVPQEDAAELELLTTQLPDASSPVESHGIDGQTVVTLVLSFYLPSIPLIKAWLSARTGRGKGCTVSIRGRKFSGYTADEVVRIVAALEELSKDEEAGE